MRFIDKKKRQIDIDTDEDGNIRAFHKTHNIGTFEFRTDDEIRASKPELVHMDIDLQYQRAGIGKEMMRFAVTHHGYFILPKPAGFEADNQLTEDGAALVSHCFRCKILTSKFEEQYRM